VGRLRLLTARHPLPSITFGTDNTKGFYSQSTNAIGMALAGAELFRFSTSGLSIFSDVIGLRLGTLSDAIILRGAADTIDQRRSTNAQTFRIYNTFTDAANYERVRAYAVVLKQLQTIHGG
jgi:hypothetical protein